MKMGPTAKSFGDDMTGYAWEAADNSDDEVEELAILK